MTREKIVSLAQSVADKPLMEMHPNEIVPFLMRFHHAAIADFMKESGQYLTNDATREACIKQAKAEALEAVVESLNPKHFITGALYQSAVVAIREMAKEMK